MRITKELVSNLNQKLFHDFVELENLQSSHNAAMQFTNMAQARTTEQIIDFLKKARPNYNISFKNEKQLTYKTTSPEHCWYITPISGLNNLLHAIPYFCINIALVKTNEKNEKEVVLSLIDNPIAKETFFAEKGTGAFVNNKRIRVSSRNKNVNTLMALTPSQKNKNIKLLKNIRVNNCTPLDLAYTAAGKYDASIIFDNNDYDTLSGNLLIKEAGGCVTDFQNKRPSDKIKNLLFSNGLIHDSILKDLN